MSNLQTYEYSEYDGNPFECYRFSYNGINYNYTSADHDITLSVDGEQEVFYSQFIQRSSIKPTGMETITVYTELNNNVAILYHGAPPEQGKVKLSIFRIHGSDTSDIDTIMRGRVSQVKFSAVQAEITVTIENYLEKEVPRGKLQYYCNNVIYDHICGLTESNFTTTCRISDIKGLTLYSDDLKQFDDDYLIGGILRLDSNIRCVTASKKVGSVTVKYPFATSAITGIFTVSLGCNGLFTMCAEKFHNTDNFTGVCYCPPTDSVKNKLGGGQYWIDNSMVIRDTDCAVGKISL